MTVCPACGKEIEAEARFCGICGANLRALSETQVPPARPEPAIVADEETLPPGSTEPPRAEAPPTLPPDQATTEEGFPCADRFLGKIVNRKYRVIEKLGEGGMGAVYHVEHLQMGKHMAMKVLLPQFGARHELVQRFRQEAKAVSKLNHVNSVAVFDFDTTRDGCLYLVMEYIRGVALVDRLADKGPLPPERTVRVAMQVCESLAEAHEMGVVHRDLKPDNIMLVKSKGERDLVKVLDFGLAKLADMEGLESVTQEGYVMGTPFYMSPEQIRGDPVDGRADLYALGAVMYQMLSGQPPFSGKTPGIVLAQHLNDAVPPLRALGLNPPVPPALERIVMRCLAKDPAERYANADALRQELERFLEQDTSPRATATSAFGEVSSTLSPVETTSAYALGQRSDFVRLERSLKRRNVAFRLLSFGIIAALASGAFYFRYMIPLLDAGREREPNNSAAEANALSFGDPVTAYLGKRISDQRGDQDWYRLRNEQRGDLVVNISVSGIPNIDTELKAFDAKGRELWDANNTSTGGAEEIRNFRIASERTIYLLVFGRLQGTVPVENVSDPYTLSVTTEVASRFIEAEPNDVPELATPLDLGALILGFSNNTRDVDYYRVARPAEVQAAALFLKVKLPPHPRVSLVDLQGNASPISTQSPVRLPEGDAFFLRVEQDAYQPNQDYRLHIEPVAAEEVPVERKRPRSKRRAKAG